MRSMKVYMFALLLSMDTVWCSYGQVDVKSSYYGHESANHEWSVGIDVVNVTFNFKSNESNSSISWFVEEEGIDSANCVVRSDLLQNEFISSSCDWTRIGDVITVTYYVTNIKKQMKNSSKVDLVEQYNIIDTSILESAVLKFFYCPILKGNNTTNLLVDGGVGASYQNVASYSCLSKKGRIIIGMDYDSPRDNYGRMCLCDVSWNGTDSVICSYAPSPSLNITQSFGKHPGNSYYAPNDTLILTCTGSLGNPKSNNISFYVKTHSSQDFDKIDGAKLPLQQKHDDSKLKCCAQNNYTEYINNSTGCSQTESISVLFAPYNENTTFNQSAALSQETTLNFSFSANPLVEYGNISLTLPDQIRFENNLSTLVNVTKWEQLYTYRIENVTKEHIGIYTLMVYSPDDFFVSPLYLSIILNESQSNDHREDPAPSKVALIIGCSVAGLFILILIGILICLCMKRRSKSLVDGKEKGMQTRTPTSENRQYNQKEEKVNPIYGSRAPGEEREERANPLYGSTVGGEVEGATYAAVQKPKKKKAKVNNSEKEEKVNPLYNPSCTNESNVEEAYAEVNKKGKKGGNENPTFTAEMVGDTYAEVDRTKKKKNDPKPDDGLHASAVV